MPFGYSPEDIAKRIKQKSGSRMYEEIAENLEKKEKLASIDEIYKNTGTYRRLYQAVSFYRLPNPYAVTKGVRRDIMAIDRLLDECAYIKTITVDNGTEFADCEGIEKKNKKGKKRTEVYYCHPYCSAERGSNENQNRMIRSHL